MLKDPEWEKGQLAQRPPIQYVPVVDVVTPKEDPAVLLTFLTTPTAVYLSSPMGITMNTSRT